MTSVGEHKYGFKATINVTTDEAEELKKDFEAALTPDDSKKDQAAEGKRVAGIKENIVALEKVIAEGGNTVELKWEPRLKFGVAYDEDNAGNFNNVAKTNADITVLTLEDDADVLGTVRE